MHIIKKSLETHVINTYNMTTQASDLQTSCDCSDSCWEGYRENGTEYAQKSYIPWVGEKYNGIFLVGINFNGGNDCIDFPEDLKVGAEEFIRKGKYQIFRSDTYGGSPVWYYYPLIAYLYDQYSTKNIKFQQEDDLTVNEIASGFDYCAISNIIKCCTVTPNHRSTPSQAMYQNCVPKFWGEMHILIPKIIVSFAKIISPYISYSGDKGICLNVPSGSKIFHNEKVTILELEHPKSTATTRKEKFLKYSNGLYEALDIMRS